jgi:integrase
VRTINRLTNRQIVTAKPEGDRRSQTFADGANLHLQVSIGPSGNIRRSWLFLYERNGQRHGVGLGPVHTIGLKAARERARGLREKLLYGIDPLIEKRQAKQALLAEQAKTVTFADVMAKYLKAHAGNWRSDDHRDQWESSMARYVTPYIGALSVAAIDTATVVRVLEPIWEKRRETASRVRGRIEAVLGFATVREFRSGDNPARWKGHLSELFAAKMDPVHLAALAYDELPAFMAELRTRDDIVAAALEFCILTVARTGRVVGARWDEINWDERSWTIEAAKMKRNREHVTPLCDRAMEILTGLKAAASPHGRIFPVGPDSMRRLLAEMRPKYTTHGCRSSFYDWCMERTAASPETIRAAMSHAIKDRTQRSYQRGQMFEKRRRLMQQWETFLNTPTAGGGVVPIRGGSHG